MNGLRVGHDLQLPLDVATDTLALLAKRRAGKSNAAVVMAEEMYDAGIPWCAIDPKGDWWGVRSSGDGTGPGLSVPIFGGLHADVPLEASAGAYVADLIARERLTCVLDLSEMSKGEQIKFLTPFAEQLLRVNREPLHLFLEECDEYIPQRVQADEARLVGAFSKLVRRGGFRGIGSTLITQRSAVVNKDVLTQTETLIVMRTTAPQDRAAVKAWLEHQEASMDVLASLASLEPGHAWVVSPRWLGEPQQATFRRRRTYDSGSTPKMGESRRTPTKLADVDLDAIKTAMGEAIDHAQANDPALLRRRIRELEKAAPAVQIVREEVPVQVPTPVLSDESAELLRSVIKLCESMLGAIPAETSIPRHEHVSVPAPEVRQPQPTSDTVSGPQQRILASLAQLRALGLHPADRTQLALFAGASPRSSSYTNNLGALRTSGLIDYPSSGRVALTEAGTAAAPSSDPARDQRTLHQELQRLVSGPQWRILEELIKVYPQSMSRDRLASLAGASPSSSSYTNNLGSLRTLGVIDYPERGLVVALPVLFLEAAA